MILLRRSLAIALSACLSQAGLGPAWASEVQLKHRAAGQERQVHAAVAALPRLDLSLPRWAERLLPEQRAEINRAVARLRETLVYFPDYPDAVRQRLGELQENALSGVPAAQAAVALLSHDPAALESQRERLSQRLTPGGFLQLKSAAKLLRAQENLKPELDLLLAAAQLQEAYDHASPPLAAEPAAPVPAEPAAPVPAEQTEPAPAEVARLPQKQAFADSSPIHTILFTPGGRYRIEGRGRSVLIREAASLKPLRRIETSPIKRIVLEGDRLFTVGTYVGAKEPQEEAHALKVWDLKQGVELGRFPGALPIEAFLVEPGGRRAWVVDYSQTLWSWDLRAGKARERLTLADKRYHALALGLQQGKVRVLARRLRDESRRLRTVRQEREVKRGSRTYLIDSRREIELIESAADFTVHLLTLKGKRLRSFRGHAGKVNAAALAPDGRFLYTASDDKTARQWSLESAAETLRFSGHKDAVLDVLAHPSGRWLFTSGADRTIKVWDARSGQELATLRGHPQGVSSLALTPDGQHLYSAGNDGASLFDYSGLAALQADIAAPRSQQAPETPVPRAATLEDQRSGDAVSRLSAARSSLSWEAEVLKIALQDDWKITGFMGATSALLLMLSPVFGAILGTVALGFLAQSLHKLGRRHAAEKYLAAEDETGLAEAEGLRANGLLDEYIPLVFGVGIMGGLAILAYAMAYALFFDPNSLLFLNAAAAMMLLSFLVSFIGIGLGVPHRAGVLAFEENNRENIERLKEGVKAAAQARRDAVQRRVGEIAETP